MAKGPVLIELDDTDDRPSVADAPPVPEPTTPLAPQGQAMQTVAQIASRRRSPLARCFWGLLVAALTAYVSAAAWDFVMGWITRQPILGFAFAAQEDPDLPLEPTDQPLDAIVTEHGVVG